MKAHISRVGQGCEHARVQPVQAARHGLACPRRLGSARLGSARRGSARLGSARLHQCARATEVGIRNARVGWASASMLTRAGTGAQARACMCLRACARTACARTKEGRAWRTSSCWIVSILDDARICASGTACNAAADNAKHAPGTRHANIQHTTRRQRARQRDCPND